MIDFRVERGWSFDGYQGWILDHRNGKTYICKPVVLEFVEIEETSKLPSPTFTMDGIFAREFIPAVKKALSGLHTFFDKPEEYEHSKRIEKFMQAHIDTLKEVVSKVLK